MNKKLLFSLLTTSACANAESYRTVCDPDTTSSVAVYGGKASCTAVGRYGDIPYDNMPSAIRKLFPRTQKLSKTFSEIRNPPDSLSLIYYPPAPVQLSKWLEATPPGGGGPFGMFYSCSVNIPFKGISTTVTKGACRQVPIPVDYLLSEIKNSAATTPGCTNRSVTGAGGDGWSLSAWELTCGDDKVSYVLKTTYEWFGPICKPEVSTLGYQEIGSDCNSFKIYKNQ